MSKKLINMVSSENSDMVPEKAVLKLQNATRELNDEITEQEVLRSIYNLRLNKALVSDLRLNEFLKIFQYFDVICS